MTTITMFQTATPIPSIYNDIVTPDGVIVSRFDFIANAGDVAIVVLLVGIVLSLWALLFIWLFVEQSEA
jgi:hypothetical protein